MDHISPGLGMKIPKIFELPPTSFFKARQYDPQVDFRPTFASSRRSDDTLALGTVCFQPLGPKVGMDISQKVSGTIQMEESWTLFSAILGVGFPVSTSRIHTAYIGEYLTCCTNPPRFHQLKMDGNGVYFQPKMMGRKEKVTETAPKKNMAIFGINREFLGCKWIEMVISKHFLC